MGNFPLTEKTKISIGLATAAAICGLVWGVSTAAGRIQSRIEIGEERDAQHTLWINQQTQRIEKAEESLNEIRVMFGKIEVNTSNLERQLGEMRRDARPRP